MNASPVRLTANIEALTAYTAQHPELRAAHHFLYDVRRPPKAKPEYLVMGINPGETDADWKGAPQPTEETSRHDFHTVTGWSKSACRWADHCEFFLGGAPYALAEAFFWSSRDGKQFKERFGALETSPHLSLCTAMNMDLIEAYEPKAVVVPGLGLIRLCSSIYDLRKVTVERDAKGRLAEHWTDGHRPWIFTKHWTGSFGFSNEQRASVRDFILSCM